MDQNEAQTKSAKELYDSVPDEHRNCSRGVLWDDPQTQYFRFKELIRPLDLNNSKCSVLDVGCGNAELYKFLNFNGYRGRYTGYDINEKLLAAARSRFAGIDVQYGDILSRDFEGAATFDYVLMSGVFNSALEGQTMDWVHRFLEKMFSLCTEGIIFNAISTHVSFINEKQFYIDPAEMLTFCIKSLSPRVTLAHHNLPYNYTTCVFKEKAWSSVRERFPESCASSGPQA